MQAIQYSTRCLSSKCFERRRWRQVTERRSWARSAYALEENSRQEGSFHEQCCWICYSTRKSLFILLGVPIKGSNTKLCKHYQVTQRQLHYINWFWVSCEHDFCRTTRSSALAHFWKLSVIFILPLRLEEVVFLLGTPSRDSAS